MLHNHKEQSGIGTAIARTTETLTGTANDDLDAHAEVESPEDMGEEASFHESAKVPLEKLCGRIYAIGLIYLE